MLEFFLFLVGFVGFGIAGWLDLKTTEFPDWLPYSMIILAIASKLVNDLLINNFLVFWNSVIFGLLFLGFGLILYIVKQWGDGDAWLLGALGFLMPTSIPFLSLQTVLFPFFTLLFTFFIISFVYLVVYSIALGFKEKIFGKFFRQFKKQGLKSTLLIFFVFLVFVICAGLYLTGLGIPLSVMGSIFLFPFFLLVVLLFLHYGKYVEKNLFKKRVAAKKLTIHDIPLDRKFRNLTEKELKSLKRKGGYVWIKEGVRLAPAFIVTFVVNYFFGNSLLWFLWA